MNKIHLITGMIKVNTFIIYKDGNAAIIDPGGNFKRIMLELETNGLTLKKILLTHGHFDHIGAVAQLKEETGAKIYIHSADEEMLRSNGANLSDYLGNPVPLTEADILISNGDIIDVFDAKVKVLHTPGHTPGSVCFYGGDELFSGDTLFYQEVGRCDFPGGSFPQILGSIENQLFVLPDQTPVYPGHDSFTTIGHEKRHNPYLNTEKK